MKTKKTDEPEFSRGQRVKVPEYDIEAGTVTSVKRGDSVRQRRTGSWGAGYLFTVKVDGSRRQFDIWPEFIEKLKA